jgi:thiol-disulfide isomerase/thioredoxin
MAFSLAVALSGAGVPFEASAAERTGALTVRHLPNPVPVSSVPDTAKNAKSKVYVWRFRTEVRNNLDVPLRIVEFGNYGRRGDEWILMNVKRQVYTSANFSEWYTAGDKTSDGWIAPGAVAADGDNWISRHTPVPAFPYKWVYTAEDRTGGKYRGECEVDLIPCETGAEPPAHLDPSRLVQISGSIVGRDGSPPAYAQVRLVGAGRSYYSRALEISVAGKNGEFSVQAPKPGWYYLFVYSPGYESALIPVVLKEEDASVTLTVRPVARDSKGTPGARDLPTVAFDGESSVRERVWRIEQAVIRTREARSRALARWIATHGDSQGFRFGDWRLEKSMSIAEKEMHGSGDVAVRQYAVVSLASMNMIRGDSEVAEALKIVPPSSPLWSDYFHLPSQLLVSCGAAFANRTLNEFVEQNPDRKIQAACLANLAVDAHADGDSASAAKYYGRLKSQYGDVAAIRGVLGDLDPQKSTAPGKPVPGFEVKLVDGSVVSDESLRGKYCLIDFWSTWCGPCVGEMKFLHEANKSFKRRNFVILSVSFDKDPKDVAKFRKGKWKLPWMNAVLEGGSDSDMAKKFGVRGIPSPFLIGPDGVILASGASLRGKDLEKTLKKHLAD